MSTQSRWLTLGTIVELLREQGFDAVDVVERHASRNGPRARLMASRSAGQPAIASSSSSERRTSSRTERRGELERRLAVAETDLAAMTKVVKALGRRHYGALPLPPEELRLHVGKTTSAANYLAQGVSSSTRVIELFGTEPNKPILDWGCGSGRTLRWLVAFEAWKRCWHGCDVDRPAIDWIRGLGDFAAEVCNDDPPLPYGDGMFGGIYCFSVMTHIHPSRHRAWYQELRRVLEPGGVAYLTTLGASTLDESRKGIHGAGIADEFAKEGFVYLRNEGHYKDGAVVSEAFTRRALDGLFTVEQFAERGYGTMDAYFVRRIG